MRSFCILLIALLLSACSVEDYEDYYREPYSSPEALASAFDRVWESGDLDEYGRRLLYDPEEVTRDGRTYPGFAFYFTEQEGGVWTRDEELAHLAGFFSGNPSPGGEVGGVEELSLDMALDGQWEFVGGATIEGDLAPSGTKRGRYEVDLVVDLQACVGSEGIDGFVIGGSMTLYVIPVDGLNGPGYRLWKWVDETEALPGQSWGGIKRLW